MQWFRLYAEFLTDPLVRMLSFDDQRHFVAALCMKAMGVTDKRYASDEIRRHVIASLMGLSAEDGPAGKNALDATNARLRKLGLVDENWQPTNWNKRQFKSDSVDPTAAERMRRYRKKNNVTRNERNVTPSEQNRTDTEQSQIQSDEPLSSSSSLLHQSSSFDSVGESERFSKKDIGLAITKLTAQKELPRA